MGLGTIVLNDWEPTQWETAYNEGRSTQVPVNPQVKVNGRFSRRLSYRGKPLCRSGSLL